MDKKTTGFLVLKDCPSEYGTIRALQRGTNHDDMILFGTVNGYGIEFVLSYCLANPDFFKAIYEGEKVCESCKGSGLDPIWHGVEPCQCISCLGRRVVPIGGKPVEKPICPKCGDIMGLVKVEATFDEGLRRTESPICWTCFSKLDEKEGK